MVSVTATANGSASWILPPWPARSTATAAVKATKVTIRPRLGTLPWRVRLYGVYEDAQRLSLMLENLGHSAEGPLVAELY